MTSAKRCALRCVAGLLLLLSAFSATIPAYAQNDKKKKKNAPPPAADNSAPIALSDEQQIDYMISEVLGYWQVGNTEMMHKDYVDDVSVVSGGWAPPIIGWTNYEALYKQQRATMQQARLDRGNTYIKVAGTTAWASFQWEFTGIVNGVVSGARGQTTYVMVKKDNHWLIAHDHTSIVQSVQQPSTNTPGNTPPPGAATPPKPGN